MLVSSPEKKKKRAVSVTDFCVHERRGPRRAWGGLRGLEQDRAEAHLCDLCGCRGLRTPSRVRMGWHWAAQQPRSPVVSNLSPKA